MFYTDEEVSVITGLLNAYLVREHASEKVRESYTRISEGLQSRVLTGTITFGWRTPCYSSAHIGGMTARTGGC